MKKTIITIGAFAALTFGATAQNWKANEAVNTLADMEEWMREDIANGRVNAELGEEYITNIQNVLKLVLTIDDEDACIRDNDIEFDRLHSRDIEVIEEIDKKIEEKNEKKRYFTLFKIVIQNPQETIALTDSL